MEIMSSYIKIEKKKDGYYDVISTLKALSFYQVYRRSLTQGNEVSAFS